MLSHLVSYLCSIASKLLYRQRQSPTGGIPVGMKIIIYSLIDPFSPHDTQSQVVLICSTSGARDECYTPFQTATGLHLSFTSTSLDETCYLNDNSETFC